MYLSSINVIFMHWSSWTTAESCECWNYLNWRWVHVGTMASSTTCYSGSRCKWSEKIKIKKIIDVQKCMRSHLVYVGSPQTCHNYFGDFLVSSNLVRKVHASRSYGRALYWKQGYETNVKREYPEKYCQQKIRRWRLVYEVSTHCTFHKQCNVRLDSMSVLHIMHVK